MKDHPGGGESISLVAGQDAVSLSEALKPERHADHATTSDRRFHVNSLASGKGDVGGVSRGFTLLAVFLS